jgi:hypothetical protein
VTKSNAKVAYGSVKRPPFDPNRAKGSLFEGSLFDPTPVARPSTTPSSIPSTNLPQERAAKQLPLEAIDEASRGGITRDARVSKPVATDDASKPVAAPAAQRIPEVSVSAFNELVARTLEDSMRGQFRVVGEIANLSRKGHWYFSIKDARAVLPCVMWQSDAARVAFTPKEGDAVVVTGKIGHYYHHFKTHIYANNLENNCVVEFVL